MAKTRIGDALDAVAILEKRLKNVTGPALETDDVLVDACAYRIGVIGEAISYAKNLVPEVLAQNPPRGFSWDTVVAVRNSFVHDYNRVNGKAVLMYATYLPELKRALANVLGAL